MNEISLIIYQNVKRLAKEKDIRIGELENKIQVSLGYLSRVQKNNYEISVEKVFQIAEIFEISLDELCRLPEPSHWIPEDSAREKGQKYRCSECNETVYSPIHIPYKKYPRPYPNCPFCLAEMAEE